MNIIAASDSSLFVEFGNTVDPALHRRVLQLFRTLLENRDPRIRNLHPAYASLLIDFNPLQLSHAELEGHVRSLCERNLAEECSIQRIITIPVCYGAEFGPDLPDVAAHNFISTNDVIHLHTASEYLVYFLGFSPGFAYLGGLAEKLRTPRLPTPRLRIPAGSVAIAAEQTGIYPVESPGGWRLIGRTPVRMFDPSANSPTRLQPGDAVRFTAIDRGEFARIAQQESRAVIA